MTLAQEPDYTALIVGCVCVSLILLLLGTLLLWKRNKHIDGEFHSHTDQHQEVNGDFLSGVSALLQI